MKRRTKSANFAPWPLPIAEGAHSTCLSFVFNGLTALFPRFGSTAWTILATTGSVGCLSSDILVISIE
jgi:hypothetical protein